MLKKRLSQVMSLLMLATAATGCGMRADNVMTAPQLEGYAYTGSIGDFTNRSYRCPKSPNVVPDWDWALDGSGRYTVCPSTESFADILIHGSTSESSQICIFPAQYIDDSHVYTKPELNGTGPMNFCATPTPEGAYAKFEKVNYNAVFIVEKHLHQKMVECLIMKNYNFCPAFSFGVFR